MLDDSRSAISQRRHIRRGAQLSPFRPDGAVPRRLSPTTTSNPPNNHRPLTLQLLPIPLLALRLAILEPRAGMTLEQTVLSAKVTLTEAAVADDALGGLAAVLCAAAYLLGWHAAAEGESHVQGGEGGDVVVGKGVRGVEEVAAGVDEADVAGGLGGCAGGRGGKGGWGKG